MKPPSISRRTALASLGAGLSASLRTPSWARGASLMEKHFRPGFDTVSGTDIDLAISSGHRLVGGRSGHGVGVNGSIPGPLIHLREGQTVRLKVRNDMDEDSSIHWHGILLPFQFDGVPGVSFPGIKPGQTFTYQFPIRQAGTYWWHSHSGLQEQSGLYGPLVIEPAGPDPIQADRDYVLLLSEFTPFHPHAIMAKLKSDGGYFNHQQTSWSDRYPLTGAERRSWARMRMMATDILDVGGSTYTYLANGRGPAEGTEFLFRAGERIRLRVINGSAMTFFNLRIPGLPLTIVAADGQTLRPVEVDELQIGVAETYDLILEPMGQAAFTIVAEAMDSSGMAVATLASASGVRAPIPELRQPPLLTMADMGMDHSGMNSGSMAGMNHDAMPGMGGMAGTGMAGMPPSPFSPARTGTKPHNSMDMHGMPMRDTRRLPATVAVGPGIDMVAMQAKDRTGDPGLGLRGLPHRTLNYRMLERRDPDPDLVVPKRHMEIHLTGNMDRYMWSFDGRKYSAVTDHPIRFAYDERIRVKLVNDTMMAHPIHLHGMFVEIVNGAAPGSQPLKHTVIVQPGGSVQLDLTANEPGDWPFHCHLLYHMHAGMFQVVTVARPENTA